MLSWFHFIFGAPVSLKNTKLVNTTKLCSILNRIKPLPNAKGELDSLVFAQNAQTAQLS